MKYQILLYYCYAKISNPEKFREDHHFFCLDLNLRGRIIIASEGINGTVSGIQSSCEKYMAKLKSDPRFAGIEFKIEPYHQHAFQKLHVRVKEEIVNMGMPQIDPTQNTGKYLEPHEFQNIKDDPQVVLLDVRSNYEHHLGKFKNALTMDLENFRDFPQKIEQLDHLRNKKVITYCTGGIKCEKASAYLLDQGFENVYQLHGGIIKYGLEQGGEDFEGKCYVFDNRVAAEVNRVNPTTLARCYLCHQLNDRMVNCANPHCNRHVPICEDCGAKLQGACSEACLNHPDKREYDGTGYYQKAMNGYNPYRGIRRGRN